MPQRGYTLQQIINKLHEAEILLGQGNVIATAVKKIGVKRSEVPALFGDRLPLRFNV
jgi:hypothetical protein